MKVLVCGGRYFNDRLAVFRRLDELRVIDDITLIIHGCASGADAHAQQWALDHKVQVAQFAADWHLGRKAGPLRNQHMADYCANIQRTEVSFTGRRIWVLAFPGNRGTRDMIKRAQAAGLYVETVGWEP